MVSEDATKGTVSGGGQYENGAQATVTASPTSGYKLSGWYEGETQVSTDKIYTFTISGNRALTARFVEAAVYTITATIDPSGSGTVTGAGQYQEGETVTLVATAGDGYEFSGWRESGQTVSTGATYTFTAAADRTLTAVFEEKVSRLPAGYTEVEYIESDSKCYIQTDIPLQDFKTRRIVMDIQPDSFAIRYERIACADTVGSFEFYISRYSETYTRFVYGTSVIAPNISITNKRITVDLDFPSKSLTIGDYQTNFAGITPNFASKIKLFGDSSSIQTKLYSAQIYISGSLSGDYVPCINPSGSVGVYDLVSAKFYANAGTGTFTAGPAV